MQNTQRQILITGVLGLIAAILVGLGEFLLHFDNLARFAEGPSYAFMEGISATRSSAGHFLAVLGAPLYLFGYWHLMKMLEPAHKNAARIAFFIVSYGIIVGATWIGSRASISAIVNLDTIADLSTLISLYEFRYENLLQVTRIAVLAFSIIFIWLTLTGRSHYPKWMALFNPILLILGSFAVWLVIPSVGLYLMPIALNVAFAILFIISIYHATKLNTVKGN